MGHITLKDNTCQGLGLAFSTNNVFLENRVLSKPWGDSGVDLSRSNNNFLYKNEISGFIYGFRFWFSSNNTIKANTATDSLSASLSFCASNDNLFSLNNFANNAFAYTPFVYDQYSDINVKNSIPNLTLSTNTWSDDNLGNYWGDYHTNYPNAIEVDSTGVGNIPYVINDNNSDSYPLITNYDISTASIQLPDWTNLNLPILHPTPSFPPPPSPSPSPNPSPTPSRSPSPTASPSPSPSSPFPTEPFPTLAAIVVSVISATLVGAGLIIYFKKRKH
jgi:parallel beta-helix repeat protein